MNSFFLYKFRCLDKKQPISITVIFCSGTSIDPPTITEEIRRFHQVESQSDKIFVIGGEYLRDELRNVFINHQDETFRGIPKPDRKHLRQAVRVLMFNENGELFGLTRGATIPEYFLEHYPHYGMQQIFTKGDGLIMSHSAHHFVFPSGKHCDRFIRTGNVLLNSPEIYFIATLLLKYFLPEEHLQIYSDTSSINSVAFALLNLRTRFSANISEVPTAVHSFGSYEGLYKAQNNYSSSDFLIISASTSGTLIEKIREIHPLVPTKNIVLLYFLGKERDYAKIQEQTICNLTESKTNPSGIRAFPTYPKGVACPFCDAGSHAISVSGDTFLLEKPKINPIVVQATNADKNLSDFVEQFRSRLRKDTILKVNHKENSADKAYQVFIDFKKLLQLIPNKDNFPYAQKLNSFIDQYIPSNTAYLLSLNDDGSRSLAKYIFDRIKKNYDTSRMPEKITQESLRINKAKSGTIVVVGSCIAKGKNLLYLSRTLRQYENLRIIYFIGIARTSSKDELDFLKGNLGYGKHGPETNSFIAVDFIFCNNNSENTSWLAEIRHIGQIVDLLKDTGQRRWSKGIRYFQARQDLLMKSASKHNRGLSENLFLKAKGTGTPLRLRKNFVFFKFENYVGDVTQSDVFFTISNVLNTLRFNAKSDHSLGQSQFHRNVISPANFTRFNDGVIQASILRAAELQELDYRADSKVSSDMRETLEMIIGDPNSEQGEAAYEFAYAFAIRKIRLEIRDEEIIIKLMERIGKQAEVFSILAMYFNFLKDKASNKSGSRKKTKSKASK